MDKIILYCEDTIFPVGIDEKEPVFSWKVKKEFSGDKQIRFKIRVAASVSDIANNKNLLWCHEESSDKMQIIYSGEVLQSCKLYYWQVQMTLDNFTVVDSNIAEFETAFFNEECWNAQWISATKESIVADLPELDEEGNAKPIAFEEIKLGQVWNFRKKFRVYYPVKKARLYATAHGMYLPILDGNKIGTYELTPEHTDYRNQLLYQIYDITEQLTHGEHTLGVILSDGWYAGRIGFSGENCQYGSCLAVLIQLQIEYANGKKDMIYSDETFEIARSAYEYADLMVGEKLDACKMNKNFFTNDFVDLDLNRAIVKNESLMNLKAQVNSHIQVLEILDPVEIKESEKDEIIIDFGKCIAGRIRIRMNEVCGQIIKIEHSEIIGTDGSFVKNIRESYKEQTDIYICSGEGWEVYEPQFTYHGFRYARIIGLTGEIRPENFQAIVIGSNIEKTGEFRCSDERLNILQENIMRSQLSNMISIPTDCPQREKAGWTGDVQVYAATACFNQNIKKFFCRWLKDVRYSQTPDGQIPIIVPYLKSYGRNFEGIISSAGWSDVIVILPWVLYQYYGNIDILSENYESMERWVEYQRQTAENKNPENIGDIGKERKKHLSYIWNTGFHFGDWLTPSASIDIDTGVVDMMQSAYLTMDIVPTIFFAISCRLMSQISYELGKKEQVGYYEKLFECIKEAFRYEYIDSLGCIKSNFQGVHVLAIKADLVNEKEKEIALNRLVELIKENDGKLDTGFLSVPYLLDVLMDAGYEELAYEILMNEECPSWLYEVKKGATSIWESWQAILPDDRYSYLSMAHYAFGCVGDWMYRHIAGIQSLAPGFKRILFSPYLHSRISYATGTYESIYGKIFCSWHKFDKYIEMELHVPFNTEAQLCLKNICISKAFKNKKMLSENDWEMKEGSAWVMLSPGVHKFCFFISNNFCYSKAAYWNLNM